MHILYRSDVNIIMRERSHYFYREIKSVILGCILINTNFDIFWFWVPISDGNIFDFGLGCRVISILQLFLYILRCWNSQLYSSILNIMQLFWSDCLKSNLWLFRLIILSLVLLSCVINFISFIHILITNILSITFLF
jgi:hypothetical protein